MLKSKSKTAFVLTLTLILNILTAFKDRVGHAPQGRGALHIII
jgi:hypothetical protein